MAGFDNDVCWCDNLDFRGIDPPSGQFSSSGQLAIGSGGSPAIKIGQITSSTLTVSYSDPNITINTAGGGDPVETFVTDIAGPVSPNATGQITLTGTHVFTDGTTANTLDFGLDATAYTFLYGSGNNVDMAELGPLTNGQLIIGSTGAAPVAATLTSADSSITITGGAGTLDIVVAGGTTVGKTITGDTGGALSPTGGNWNILGGAGVVTSGAGSTLTIDAVAYTDHAAPTSVAVNTGSFATAAIALTLPAAPSQGDRCEFIATTAGALAVTCAGTQVGHLGSSSTTAGGTFTSTAAGDALALIYQSATDDWWAISSTGSWTLA